MIDVLGYAFFQRALIAGVIAGVLCGLFSVFVVAKRMAFIGQGISHAAFGGISLGLLLGIDPNLPASVFAITMALGVSYLSGRSARNRDVAIGVLLALSMALGIVFLSLSSGYKGSVMSYLFGNILAVSRSDLVWLIAITFFCTLFLVIFAKELKFYIVSEDIAGIYGIPVNLIQTLLLISISMAVIAALRIVGIILVTSLFLVPGAVSLHFSKSYKSLFFLSAIISVLTMIIGLFASYILNIPSGASIVIILSIIYIATELFKRNK